jgi:hypothetical protein
MGNQMSDPHKRIGIIGPSECGKTQLAKSLSVAYWQNFRIRSLVLDPRNSTWKYAWRTTDENIFWQAVWGSNKPDARGNTPKPIGDLIIVDEGSSTIARDKDLIPLFNQIRHHKHILMVLCHRATNLLPDMRQELNELFLFIQTPKAVEIWQEEFPDMKGLENALTLNQYEFLHCKKFSTGEKKKLAL